MLKTIPKKPKNKKKTEPRTLPGFMELLPNEQILFEQMKQKIEKVYQRFGFLPMDTPIIELSEVLLAKAGGETEKQIYRFEKGDKDLSLRFDLTVPLAKYVAKNYGNLSFPYRRYQIGKRIAQKLKARENKAQALIDAENSFRWGLSEGEKAMVANLD